MIRAAALAAALGLTVAGCGERTIDPAAMEDEIAVELERTVGERPRSVDCPGDVAARSGATARCRVTARGGERSVARVELLDGDGRFRIEVVPAEPQRPR